MLQPESFDAALVPGFRAAMRDHYRALSAVEQASLATLRAASVFRPRDCPVCDHPADGAQRLERFSRPDFSLLRCPGCRLVYSREVFCQSAERDRYARAEADPDSIPQAFAALKASAPYARLEAGKIDYVLQQLAPFFARPGNMLDIGCAQGAVLDGFAAAGWRVAGVEPAPDFAARARARHPEVRCGFFPGDAPGGPFALVTLFDVLEHLERPREFLAAIRERLRPGGILALQVPNFDSPLVQVEGAASTVVTPGHWSYFDPASLTRLLILAGFQPVALQSYISELDRLLAHPPDAVRAALGPWAPEDLSTLRPADLFWRQLGFKLFGLFRRPE
ncbi:class I SAM-dependent methyltransferase [Roseomonas sp. USHLN139]|uniref:class I SAM-dependent methyltransferase n=1 Tax=Roseomonas sp. USHLN139 TaxID=3081298 RepID=UPI003B0215AC